MELSCSLEGSTVVQKVGCFNRPHAVAIVRTHQNPYRATTTLSPGAVTRTLSGDKAALCPYIFVRTETERFWMKRSWRCVLFLSVSCANKGTVLYPPNFEQVAYIRGVLVTVNFDSEFYILPCVVD